MQKRPMAAGIFFAFVLGILLAAQTTPSHAAKAERRAAIQIVAPEGADTPWLVTHAADELARYAAAATSGTVSRLALEAKPDKAADATLVLTLDAGDALRALPGGDDALRVRDGFILESSGKDTLKIRAAEPIGLLYGVYEYLEQHAGFGFFWDGDYIPQLKTLPTAGIDAKVLPRWGKRVWYNLDTSFGFDKYHQGMRSDDARHQVFDWFAKRRINLTSRLFIPDIQASGEVAKQIFDLDDTQPSRWAYAGWPGDRSFSAAETTRRIQDDLSYSRARGIQWMYSLAYGRVPHEFRERHPDLRYLPKLGYNNTEIHPDDPACELWSDKFFRALIETYGTDHYYDISPYCESEGADSPEASFELKMNASRKLLKHLKQIDPVAIWVTGSWDFYIMPKVWTAPRITQFLKEVPHDDFRIFDSMSNDEPFYQRTNYFEGARWWYGVLHSFQGDDHLHGNVPGDFAKMHAFASDPKATACEGVCICPESTGHNILYYDMIASQSWMPEQDFDAYMTRFTERRYGKQDAPALRAAWDQVIKAVYTDNKQGQIPMYKKLAKTGYPHAWPIIEENEQKTPHPAHEPAGIAELTTAVQLGLALRESQAGNPLYENDIVDWARTALAHRFNHATLMAYEAFKAGKIETMRAQIDDARFAMRWIDLILSTRPDFSMQRQIDRVMTSPGINPQYPWGLKQHHTNDEYGPYSATEAYEPLHSYYAPRMEVYFRKLDQLAQAGVRKITWADLADEALVVQTRFLENEIRVPASEAFPGAPLDAVAAALTALAAPLPGSAPAAR
jgi:hypothetical protein